MSGRKGFDGVFVVRLVECGLYSVFFRWFFYYKPRVAITWSRRYTIDDGMPCMRTLFVSVNDSIQWLPCFELSSRLSDTMLGSNVNSCLKSGIGKSVIQGLQSACQGGRVESLSACIRSTCTCSMPRPLGVRAHPRPDAQRPVPYC